MTTDWINFYSGGSSLPTLDTSLAGILNADPKAAPAPTTNQYGISKIAATSTTTPKGTPIDPRTGTPVGYEAYLSTQGGKQVRGAEAYDLTKDPWSAWHSMSPAERDHVKTMLYYSGQYKPTDKVFLSGGEFTDADVNALKSAMNIANVNAMPSWQQAIKTQFEYGMKTGHPFTGMKGDGSDLPKPLTPAEKQQQAAQFSSTIDQFTYNNGIKLTDGWKQHAFGQVLSGDATLPSLLQNLRETTVASAFPSWAEQIKGGQDVAQLASPYIGAMSNLLEIPSSKIDLFNPTVRQAMQGNGDGNTVPLWQFERQLKADPRWQYTDNAHTQMASFAQGLQNWLGVG